MTTPAAMNDLIQRIHERWEDALKTSNASFKSDHNSYGAGYDGGFADALKEVLTDITGEEPVSNGDHT